MRFCLVTVVRGQKDVVNVHDDHSDEMSRRDAQADEGRVQFERCPGVSLERVTPRVDIVGPPGFFVISVSSGLIRDASSSQNFSCSSSRGGSSSKRALLN